MPPQSFLEKLLQLPHKTFMYVSMERIKVNLLHVRPPERKHKSASPIGQIYVKFYGGDWSEHISIKCKLAEIGHKYGTLYI
jgi:hypothetical protein